LKSRKKFKKLQIINYKLLIINGICVLRTFLVNAFGEKKKNLYNTIDFFDLFDIFAEGVKHRPAGYCFRF